MIFKQSKLKPWKRRKGKVSTAPFTLASFLKTNYSPILFTCLYKADVLSDLINELDFMKKYLPSFSKRIYSFLSVCLSTVCCCNSYFPLQITVEYVMKIQRNLHVKLLLKTIYDINILLNS